MSYKAILAGASGLIGSKLLALLTQCDQISEILSIVRKSLDISDPKIRQLIVNFDEYGLKNGASQFHVVSSIGADAASSNSYLKLKGELENELKKYRSILAETVARAMLYQSLKGLKGSFIYPSNQIQQLA